MATLRRVFAEIQRANRRALAEAERQRKASAREHAARVRELEKARKAEERAALQAQRAAQADEKQRARETKQERARLEKEAKVAHENARVAEVDELNAGLQAVYSEIDALLEATVHVDDYVDLEKFRVSVEHAPFNPNGLDRPTPLPTKMATPIKPEFVEPPPLKGLFSRKKRLMDARKKAHDQHHARLEEWDAELQRVSQAQERLQNEWEIEEQQRLELLKLAQARYRKECSDREAEAQAHNLALDKLIGDLGYGASEAIEEYISIVAANSAYPDCFPVAYEAKFDPSTAELALKVTIPAPTEIPTVKSYRYVKSRDEITSSEQSKKAQRDRYAGATHQVAIRAVHEIFESDRSGIIKSVALQLGTEMLSPATGLNDFFLFIAVAVDRKSFEEIHIGRIEPEATLKHLRATVSKNPHDLLQIDSTGIRTL